ncbi:putative sugar phosphate/phosphate translocator [Citrus sinensis]|uniref:Sugar phosphate/phosphate translocator n=1 Tax=Citrus sinensis TaxID=2711 RepID=A0ACB8MF86_CITSI|nr:putative sugar phosphate/phosphate translocator [Citrus sinensis]
MNLLMDMAPVAAMSLLPAVLIMENVVVGITIALAKQDVEFLWYLIFNSFAFGFQVLGTAKGAIAVVVSIHIFRNPVSITGMSGWTLTIIGVVLYNEAKKQSK